MTYSEKLKDPRWQKKRLEILERDNWACVYCSDAKSTLHVHHLKYNGDPFESDNNDLETVCKYCHAFIEYYKNFTGLKFKRYNCSLGKLYMSTTFEVKDKIVFVIVYPDGTIEDFTTFDKTILYNLKKFFK